MSSDSVPIKILIAEDHSILRLGLRLLLEGQNLAVVGEAEDGARAVDLTLLLQPDVVIMDVGMPVMNGIEAAQVIRQHNDKVKIIMFTSTDNEEHIYASLGAGVNGYCLKEISAERLVAGINIVRDGDLWLDSNIASKVMRQLPGKSGNPTGNDEELTREELSILHLIVEGLTVADIAARLNVDELVIRERERTIMDKLARVRRVQNAIERLDNGAEAGEPGKVCNQCQRTFEAVFKCCPYDGAELAEFVRDPLIGTIFADRYEIISRIGKGGMSVVYKARHIFLNRMVAIKVLKAQLASDVSNARRFRQEAEAASAIRHPNVITVFDFGLSTAGEPYLVMDFLEGQNLNHVIETEGRLSPDRAIDIFLDVVDGLAELHRHGIIHRDLKPSNIMLLQRNGRETACLIDFGIVKVVQPDKIPQRLTRAGEVLGSPCYISPEQAQNLPLDARSDIYSLGCAMYESICGELPFYGDFPWETMMKHVTEPAEPFNVRSPQLRIPEALNAVVMCALEKLPENRFQSMQDLKHGLMFAKASPV